MGCDIHAYVEVLGYPDAKQWSPFGGRMGSRNYEVFEAMAGVRGDESVAVVPPRGMPKDIGYEACLRYTLWVVEGESGEEGLVGRAQAEKWVKDGSSEPWDEGGVRITGPGWHTPSWLSLAEMRAVRKRVPTPWTKAICALMGSLGKSYPLGVRIVFFFDN